MKDLVSGINLIIRKKDSLLVIIISTFIFLFLLLLSQNWKNAFQILNFDSLSLWKRSMLFVSIIFDFGNTFVTPGATILAILGSFIGGINISLAYTYLKTRGKIIFQSGLYHGIGLVLAFLGIGCGACGTALLSVILGFFGFSAMLNVLPYQGEEIGYIGLLFLCIATYSLAKKVMEPNVC